MLLLDHLRADLRYAFRTFLRTPGFNLMAILSLALGIGANTLVFSVVNALVLKPLPVADPDRLVFVERTRGHTNSFPNYRDLRDRTNSFDGLVGYRISPMNLDAGSGASIRTWGYLATGNYFDVLGVRSAIGRVFHQGEDLHPGEAALAVLSYDCWTSRFAADPAIVGRTIRLNRTPFTVVGVTPQGFRGTERFYQAEIWVPMMMEPQIEVGNPWLEERMTSNTWVLGRLKRGVTAGAATGDLNAVAAQLAREYPRANDGLHLKLARPGLAGDALGSPVRAFTFGVLTLAALVLLAACTNLASVLAARGADRRREFAIRISMGAGRGRLVRQLLTETLLLSTMGGAAGWLLAVAGGRALSAWHAPVDFPVQFNITVDSTVLLFACMVSVGAGVLFGLAPARQAVDTDPNDALKEGAGSNQTGRRWAVRDALVPMQVALCVVIVSACLLSLRGLQKALTMSIGMNPRGVSMVGFDLGLAGYSREQGSAFQQRALAAVAQLPGVTSAAYSNSLPLSIDYSTTQIYPEDQPSLRAAEARRAVRYEVSPDFLGTLGIKLSEGRDIERRDGKQAPRVAIVNRAFARTIMRADDCIGRRFAYGWRSEPVEIVGLVKDGKYWSLTEPSQPAVFEPILQAYNATTTLLVRSNRPPEQLVADMRQTIAALDPQLTLYQTGTVEQMLGFALFPSRAAAVALSAFGVLAIVLAATGIHGLVAYAVSKRRREIGIRVAIGASPGNILRVVLGRILALLAIGAAAGLVLATAAGRVLSSVVYQASASDPLVLGGVVAIFLAIGVLSSWTPARRSLRIEPMSALRTD